MDVAGLRTLLEPVIEVVGDRPLDSALEALLENRFAPGGALFRTTEAACHAAIAAGWMCAQGTENRRFGRVIEADEQSHGLSVDVVDLTDLAGPHHRHPRGEICMVMPQTPGATFDGRQAGWLVFAPHSAHQPTVRNGRALILYLLPGGEIEFSEPRPGNP